MKRTRKGFTLVELLVVIAILAVLATVSVVGYTSFIKQANNSAAMQELTQIKNYYIAANINDEFTMNQAVVTELGFKGTLEKGTADNKVCYKYTLDEGTAYWYLPSHEVTTTAPSTWATCAHVDTNPADHTCDLCGTPNITNCSGGTATCTEKAECSICGEEYGDLADHNYNLAATCTSAATCVCGAVDPTGAALGHQANNENDKCGVCDHIHTPKTAATCVAQAVCECGKAYGSTNPNNHSFNNNVCACGAKVVYLIPSSTWASTKTTYLAWCWNDDKSVADLAVTGTDSNNDGVYEFIIPKGYNEIIFADMKSGKTEFDANWNNVDHQTADLTVPTDGTNIYYSVDMYQWYSSIPQLLYLKPEHWNTQNAWFAAYFFGNGDTYVKMEDKDKDGIYACEMPTVAYTKVIFYRMNPQNTALTWESKWNQSGDLTLPTDGKNLWSPNKDKWDGDLGTWSTN